MATEGDVMLADIVGENPMSAPSIVSGEMPVRCRISAAEIG